MQTTTTATTYYVSGPVRGSCGHKHRNPSTAARCAAKDHRDCKSCGGYSDRMSLRRHDDRDVTTEEHDEFLFVLG